MRKTPRRKFTLSDAMILVAATALALALMRHRGPLDIESQRLYINILNQLRDNILTISFVAAMWSLAGLVLRLRQPRPDVRFLTRQHGMVAFMAAAVVLAIRLINFGSVLSILVIDGAYFWPGMSALDWDPELLRGIPSEIGCAVAAACIIQATGGRWRSEPSWIDRMGRILGIYWIGTIPFAWFSVHIG
jgi:hypothetical protein